LLRKQSSSRKNKKQKIKPGGNPSGFSCVPKRLEGFMRREEGEF